MPRASHAARSGALCEMCVLQVNEQQRISGVKGCMRRHLQALLVMCLRLSRLRWIPWRVLRRRWRGRWRQWWACRDCVRRRRARSDVDGVFWRDSPIGQRSSQAGGSRLGEQDGINWEGRRTEAGAVHWRNGVGIQDIKGSRLNLPILCQVTEMGDLA